MVFAAWALAAVVMWVLGTALIAGLCGLALVLLPLGHPLCEPLAQVASQAHRIAWTVVKVAGALLALGMAVGALAALLLYS